MKPENLKDRKSAYKTFIALYLLTTIVLFVSGVMTLITANKGIDLLDEKKSTYDLVFKKQAEINFQLEQLFQDISSLKYKERTTGEHKQMQKIITKNRLMIEQELSLLEDQHYYEVYQTILDEIKSLQAAIDQLDKEKRVRHFHIEQLEKCRQKYQELTKKKNR